METFWITVDSAIIIYIIEIWIPYKQVFVAAWTEFIAHFDHTETSRGESSPHMIKQYMLTSMNNLLSSCEKLYLAIEW